LVEVVYEWAKGMVSCRFWMLFWADRRHLVSLSSKSQVSPTLRKGQSCVSSRGWTRLVER
jgi:hypothetical protein